MNLYDLIRLKEQKTEQLQKEIEALRLAAKLLEEAEGEAPLKNAIGAGGPIAVGKQFP